MISSFTKKGHETQDSVTGDLDNIVRTAIRGAFVDKKNTIRGTAKIVDLGEVRATEKGMLRIRRFARN